MRVPERRKSAYPWGWAATIALLAVLSVAVFGWMAADRDSPAEAATLTVRSTDDLDDGSCDFTHCSLREAVKYAANNDTIRFTITGGGTISLGTTLDTIDQDNLTIQGQTGVTIETAGNFPAFTIDTNGVTLQNLVLDGDNAAAHGILFLAGADNNTVDGVDVSDFAWDGIHFTDNNDNNTVIDSNVHDNGGDGIQFAFAAGGSDDNVIDGTTIEENNGDGVGLSNGDDNRIVNSTIDDNGGDGVYASGEKRLTIDPTTISKNDDDGVELNGCDNCTVEDSTIDDNADHGIYLHGSGTDNSILNNAITDNGDAPNEYGVLVEAEDDLLIQGNTLSGNRDAQISIGSLAANEDVDLFQNTITSGSNGIEVQGSVTSANIDVGLTFANRNVFRGTLGSGEYHFVNFSAVDIDAEYNDWNNYDVAGVDGVVCHDFNGTYTPAEADATCIALPPGNGDVDYQPFTSSPSPLPTPTSTATNTPLATTPAATNTPGTPTATNTQAPTSTPLVTSTPTAKPTETVSLTTGCQIKTFIPHYAKNTALSTVAGDITGAAVRFWFQKPGTVDFDLYDPKSAERSDVTTLTQEAGFVCADGPATWKRPKA